MCVCVCVCVCGQNVSVCLLVMDESAIKHLKNASSFKNAFISHLHILYTCIYMCLYVCVCIYIYIYIYIYGVTVQLLSNTKNL